MPTMANALQTIAPPTEAIVAAAQAGAACVLAGAVSGVVVGLACERRPRLAHVVGAASYGAGALAAAWVILGFDAGAARAVDRVPLAMALAAIAAPALGLPMAGWRAAAAWVGRVVLAGCVVALVGLRMARLSWSLAETASWIGVGVLAMAAAWFVADRLRRGSAAMAIAGLATAALAGGASAAMLLSGGLSRFPPVLAALGCGVAAAVAGAWLVRRVVGRQDGVAGKETPWPGALAAAVVPMAAIGICVMWLVGIWTGSAQVWEQGWRPRLAFGMTVAAMLGPLLGLLAARGGKSAGVGERARAAAVVGVAVALLLAAVAIASGVGARGDEAEDEDPYSLGAGGAGGAVVPT